MIVKHLRDSFQRTAIRLGAVILLLVAVVNVIHLQGSERAGGVRYGESVHRFP